MGISIDVEQVKGFLDESEGQALYNIAKKAAQIGPCLEIGSYCGKSTVYIGTACKENGSVLYSIDHHRGSEEQQPGEEYFDPELFDLDTYQVDTFTEFRKTIVRTGLTDTVIPIVCPSETAARHWGTALSMVFIDGGHALQTVRRDYELWAGNVISGGYLIFHDIFPNPADGGQAPYETYCLAVSSGLYIAEPMVKTLGILHRKL